MNEGFKTHDLPNLTMLTYPRSGRHWLYWYVKTNTDLKMRFLHYSKSEENKDYYKDILSKPIITIVRSPEECLSSINTMEHNGLRDYRINEYLDHYNFILNKANLFFDYDDLKHKTPNIIEKICNTFGGKALGVNDSFADYKKWHEETQKNNLITSKNYQNYEDNLSYINSIDLSEHNALYLKAKNQCIKL